MPRLLVLSTQPLAGKTTVAIALAEGFAASGTQVQLVRVGAGDAATEDAASFAGVFAASSPGSTVVTAPAAGADVTQVVELDAGATPENGPAVMVVRGVPTAEDKALASSLGDNLLGTIATGVVPDSVEDIARELTNGGFRPIALIPEDKVLAAPSVGEIRDALQARVLYDGDNAGETVEDILVAPVYADPARPHLRRFASKAVLAPFNKTDLHLAIIDTNAACLVITGGRDPSPYVLDRAQHDATTILLAPHQTPETIAALSDVWMTSRFRGERKAAAVRDALAGRVDFAGLAKKLQA
jgi:BioD-like phosphotransacetylase family protein